MIAPKTPDHITADAGQPDGSGQQLQRQSVRERPEVAPIGGRDPRNAPCLRDGNHGGIDESELEVGKTPIQFGNAPVSVMRKIGNRVIALDETLVEDLTGSGADPMAIPGSYVRIAGWRWCDESLS